MLHHADVKRLKKSTKEQYQIFSDKSPDLAALIVPKTGSMLTDPQSSSVWGRRCFNRVYPLLEYAHCCGWVKTGGTGGCLAERKSTLCPPPPPIPHPHLPLFYCEQLDRSAVIGCTSSTWAALPFLAVPNGAANSMLLAGWQSGRWEPANGRLDETQAPVNCTVGSLRLLRLWPASCHLRFGLINPLRAENHSGPSLFNYSLISSPL